MSDTEDKKIVQQVLNGDTMAFAKLIERHQGRVYSLSLRMTGNVEDAKDITQNVFLKVYSGLSRYNPDFKFFSWLYKSAINESINHIKSNRFHKLSFTIDIPHEETAEVEIINDERKKIVRDGVMKLKPKYRALIVLKYFEEMSYEEICTLTGLSIKKVRSRLFEARNLLRKSLNRQI